MWKQTVISHSAERGHSNAGIAVKYSISHYS
jgi:hypothetical protein